MTKRERMDLVEQMRLAGHSANSIAAVVGVSAQTVRNICKLLALPAPHNPICRRPPGRPSLMTKEAIDARAWAAEHGYADPWRAYINARSGASRRGLVVPTFTVWWQLHWQRRKYCAKPSQVDLGDTAQAGVISCAHAGTRAP